MPANDIQQLGDQWAASQSGSAVLVWRFAQSLMGFAQVNPETTLSDIGVELAKAENRARGPYHKSFVSRAIKAARETTIEPETNEQAAAFLDLFYGNDSRRAAQIEDAGAGSTTGSGDSMTAEKALKKACKYARQALSLGCGAPDIEAAISNALV